MSFNINKNAVNISVDQVENDTIELLGYDPSYKRTLRTMGSVCLVLALTAPLGAISVSSFYQITNGGYWGLTWGWIIPSIIYFPQVLAISELCSSLPINGTAYWWTAALAPPRWSRPLSFTIGCTTVLTLFTSVASFSFACASSIVNTVAIIRPGWVATPAQTMGIAMGVVLVWAMSMMLRLDRISLLYIVCTIILISQTLAYIIGLPVTRAVKGLPFASGADVFGRYDKYSHLPTGVAVPMTWFCAAWVNSAWLSSAYVAEGTHDAPRAVPKAMIISYLSSAIIGATVCIVSAFCITDMDALAADSAALPLFKVILEHWDAAGSFVFLIFGILTGLFGGSGYLLANSFQMAAFARDGGLPLASHLAFVHGKTNTPIYSAALLVTGVLLILLLALSPVASFMIYSLATMVNLITFSVPVCLRLVCPQRFVPGPFSLGRWSKPVFAFALVAQVYLIIMEAFPPTLPVDAKTFNYNWVLAVAALVLSASAHLVWGSRFHGPSLQALAHYRYKRSQKTDTTKTESIETAL